MLPFFVTGFLNETRRLGGRLQLSLQHHIFIYAFPFFSITWLCFLFTSYCQKMKRHSHKIPPQTKIFWAFCWMGCTFARIMLPVTGFIRKSYLIMCQIALLISHNSLLVNSLTLLCNYVSALLASAMQWGTLLFCFGDVYQNFKINEGRRVKMKQQARKQQLLLFLIVICKLSRMTRHITKLCLHYAHTLDLMYYSSRQASACAA